MPVKVPDGLAAKEQLADKHINLVNKENFSIRVFRPLKIVILNLMPLKQQTELQLLRMLGNTPLYVEVTFLRTESYTAKNTSAEHMNHFYKTLHEVKDSSFDGMIITGAPVENLPFESVQYWKELTGIFDWSRTNVKSTLHICWGAQAALYYHYGIQKYRLPEKVFGIYEHTRLRKDLQLLKGFDDHFSVPHSRYTDIRKQDIESIESLEILAESSEAGVYLAASKDGKDIFSFGHSEYDRGTLHEEYKRDKEKGLNTGLPKNYFPHNDENLRPRLTWRSHAQLLYSNWLNYHVCQEGTSGFILECN